MNYRIRWSDEAKQDFVGIIAYLAQFDDQAATRIASKLIECANSLRTFPYRGRSIGNGLRQMSLVYPYQLRYRVLEAYVEIISIRHGARAD